MPIAGAVQLERGRSRQPGSGLPLALLARRRDAPARLLRRDPDEYGRARRADRRARASACTATPSRRASRAHVLLDLRHQHLQLPRQGAVVAAAPARATAPSPASARPAAGRRVASCISRCASRGRSAAHGVRQRDRRDIPYKGFPPPGATTRRNCAADRGPASWSARFDFGDAPGATAAGEGGDLAGERGRRHRQPRRRGAGLGFRRRARATRASAWAQALGADRHRRRRAAMRTQLLHRALPRVASRRACSWTCDGRYRGPDNAVHQAKGFTNYSTFSLWDTFAPLHPLLTLLQPPQRTHDIVSSLLAAHRERA